MIAYDKSALANTSTRGFFDTVMGMFTARALADFGQINTLKRVDRVDVPVFVQLADADALFPASLGQSPALQRIPECDGRHARGHSFNLHRSRGTSCNRIDAWIAATLLR